MTEKSISTAITILGKSYPIRCNESEFPSLQAAAEFLNKKMLEVQESGKAINLERIAIITALNLSHELLQGDHQANSFMDRINQRITQIQNKLESAINQSAPTELLYTTE